MKLNDNITTLKGVGKKRSELLKKLNIESLEDLINFFPRRYEDRRQPISIMEAPYNQDVLLEVTVATKRLSGNPYSKKQVLNVLVEDGTATLELIFFNAKYLSSYFNPGERLSIFGKIIDNFGRRQMAHPEFHTIGSKEDVRGLIPIYPLTEGISQNQMRSMMQEVKPLIAEIKEWLPSEIVIKNNLCSMEYALNNIHFPLDERPVLEGRYRLIFEELLVLQTGLFLIKDKNSKAVQGAIIPKSVSAAPFFNILPFEFTEGQKRVFSEIEEDLALDKPMNRLVQGDVGSGKTAVAEAALYKAYKAGFQGVMMAPTELLAKQHFNSLSRDFNKLGIKCGILSSGLKTSERRQLLEELKSGEINILIGTHAIIQPDVEFNNLGLVITDEQHRFGVNQRAILSEKGNNPNVLVMTATPIPRTLALILYGDLDISIIDTMPKGRKPIKTFFRKEDARDKIYDFVEAQVKEGRQAYVVAPLIEESEVIEVRSAEEIYEELRLKYVNLKIGLVHGNMNQVDKDNVMENFAKGEIDVLVSTVVIEVGIDVGNATVMVIENSERFGLAQLHQLRGRVGRSDKQSYCILISNSEGKIALKRNEIMCQTEDGFTIAEEDLKLRGPGEMFGLRQHGLPELNISDLVKNVDILETVKVEAKNIIEKDSNLSSEENTYLKRRIQKLFGTNISLKL